MNPQPAPARRAFLPLAAKTEDALKDLAERYLTWLDERLASPDLDEAATLADLAYTAGHGTQPLRAPGGHRLHRR